MTFNSNIFLFFFFPVSVIGYHLLNQKFKVLFLFLVSFFFYSWNGVHNIIFILMILILNYIGSYLLNRYPKKLLLIFLLGCNLAALFYFKYVEYLLTAFQQFFSLQLSFASIIAPLGISFIVFHAISYLVDIYRDPELYQSSFLELGLYITFFPKVLQGPIVSFQSYKKQIKNLCFTFDFFVSGLERFIIGLAKKVIIADVLFEMVSSSLDYWKSYQIDQPTYWLVMIGYFFVIYFDFSGYSDMAIGASRMFGYDIEENFNFPYISTSVTEFWRRWHISLGHWFKNYVYIPLGGNRRGNVYFHLMTVFVLTGIWHGAGFLYLGWGLLHGSFILVERILMEKNLLHKIPKFLGWGYTTLVVSFGWLIFLLPEWDVLSSFLLGMFGLAPSSYIPFSIEYILTKKICITLLIAAGSYLLALPAIQNYHKIWWVKSKCYQCAVYAGLLLLLVYSLLSIISGTYSPFIYFQF